MRFCGHSHSQIVNTAAENCERTTATATARNRGTTQKPRNDQVDNDGKLNGEIEYMRMDGEWRNARNTIFALPTVGTGTGSGNSSARNRIDEPLCLIKQTNQACRVCFSRRFYFARTPPPCAAANREIRFKR